MLIKIGRLPITDKRVFFMNSTTIVRRPGRTRRHHPNPVTLVRHIKMTTYIFPRLFMRTQRHVITLMSLIVKRRPLIFNVRRGRRPRRHNSRTTMSILTPINPRPGPSPVKQKTFKALQFLPFLSPLSANKRKTEK